ncbi:uncharacterized protein LOC126660309 isoform X2 [Mercurialis annua]|uniref:uncharacterized protein LOC126660309 isoform X2 n=1 Tax=Mercurialis annua TaxID=3986 RepID=UPI0021600E01|nr:uncharacterized protein LOC126660309 isoform X2 [Mercurialis annua]
MRRIFNYETAVSQNVFLVCRRCNTNQMNSVTIINPLSYSSSHSFPRYRNHTCNFFKSPRNSFSTKRRRSRSSRRHKITPTDTPSYIKRSSLLSSNDSDTDANLKLVLDVNSITYRFNHFVSLSKNAYYDLQTLISLDDDNRIVVSCRKSTLQFTGAVLLGGFVLVSVIRVFVKLGLGFRSWIFKVNNRGDSVVVRRDRSLGGKEVVVARRDVEVAKKPQYGTSLDNLISLGSGLGRDDWRSYRVKHASKLPKWWPVLLTTAGEDMAVVDKQEYQRDANRLVREITDYRTSGKDVTEHEIIQLRRICRTSGVQVSFDTTNTRDSFYRASVDYVLDICSRDQGYSTSVQIDGEDPKDFVAGLAENIGLENTRAARMVSAAVAARTRSRFLQALEVQGKHYEAAQELSKTCIVLQTFPPEESSPEMEMVARGLGKNLKLEQRELLMNMFVSVCGEESHRSAADALGLMPSPRRVGDEQESKLAT